MRDPIFKGATRPAMMAGVPVLPLILVVGICVIAGLWSAILVHWLLSLLILASGFMAVLVMRFISSQDPHRLNQWLLRFRDIAHRKNVRHWGAHSMSPTEYADRKNHYERIS